METRFFGIRHHGPGSAKALVRALQAYQPSVLVIESPDDGGDYWQYLAMEGFVPPVALLIYNVANLAQAAYYPFAVFSPEWNAVHYAQEKGIPIVNMDLPQAMRWAYQATEEEKEDLFKTPNITTETSEETQALQQEQTLQAEMSKDPLGYLARLAGYNDIERWWESVLEHQENEVAIFDTLLSLMTEMRAAAAPPIGAEALREAYMRKILRKVEKEGYERIAVVCGAWHTPALAALKQYKSADDNQLLAKVGKVKTQFTWIPWTYNRLATQSGYGAGVISPAWYEFIFLAQSDALINWMSTVAALLRKEDLEASSANVIEAVRLAETLAIMRGLNLPGIDELWESAVAIFGQGNEMKLELVRHRWIIGNKIGDVPAKIPSVPLYANIEAQAKALRIPKPTEKAWLKATAQKQKGGLDLRKEHDRLQSQFLHRLNVLNIRWGELGSTTGRELGTMNEYWQLKWQPELVLDIIEVGMWGNTLEEAATNYIFHTAKSVTVLSELATLFQKGLKANLPAAIDTLAQHLQKLAALTTDVAQLIQSLTPLVYAQRYGDVRKTDTTLLERLIHELVPRAIIGLPNACSGLDEEQSRMWKKHIEALHQTITLLQKEEYSALWHRNLYSIATQEAIHALLRGHVTRLLFDVQKINAQETANWMYRQLSPSQEMATAAAWIEGFLSGSSLLLLHHPILWKLMDEWVSSLPEETFKDILPVLRRTFSAFSVPERQKILQMVKNNTTSLQPADTMMVDSALVRHWLPTMELIFG